MAVVEISSLNKLIFFTFTAVLEDYADYIPAVMKRPTYRISAFDILIVIAISISECLFT
jgi:hypothetical protein